MLADIAADMEVHMVADVEVEKVADEVADKVADMVADMAVETRKKLVEKKCTIGIGWLSLALRVYSIFHLRQAKTLFSPCLSNYTFS